MTKEREIIIFVKSQPPFHAHRQFLDVSQIDLPARVTKFRSLIFHGFRIIIGFCL